jgi:F0F1-type ATP synthase delta subunit
MNLSGEPITIAAVMYAVVELTKYVKNRHNFGLTDIQNQRQKNVEDKVERIYSHITRHHELNEERQERMAETLDDISKNMLKMTIVLDNILSKLNK